MKCAAWQPGFFLRRGPSPNDGYGRLDPVPGYLQPRCAPAKANTLVVMPTVLVLSKRRAETDFRQFLIRAFRDRGLACYRIDVKTRSVLQGPSVDSRDEVLSPVQLLGFLHRASRGGNCLVLDSLNYGLPFFSILMRLSARRAVWVYDVHDDFLYDVPALKRAYVRFATWIHAGLATFAVHAAPALGEIRNSHHLGNASHLTPRSTNPRRYDRVLILASIDERFDFDLVATIAASGKVAFDIFGGISGGLSPERRADIEGRLTSLCANPNIAYRGGYDNAEIASILDGYSVMFAPYDVASRSIRYIDPLRFYHCLNYGLQVISTSIPAVRYFADVHVVGSPEDFARAMDEIAGSSSPVQHTAPSAGRTWGDKAGRLLALAQMSWPPVPPGRDS